MTIFVSIYYPYLTLINPCMHMYFLNRIEWLIFLGQILNPRVTYFLGPKECIPRGPPDSVTRGIPSVREIPIHLFAVLVREAADGVVWEKNTTGWLVAAAGVVWEENTIGWC